MSPILVGLSFLAGFLLIFGVNFLLSDVAEAQRLRARQRLDEEIRERQLRHAKSSMVNKDLYQAAADGLVDLDARRSPREWFVNLVHESGMMVQPVQIGMVCVILALASVIVAGMVWRQWALGAGVGLVLSVLPVLYIILARRRRLEKLLSQLPNAFDLMCRSLRAGQTIAQALQTVADECPQPIAEEFGICFEQQNLGLSPEAAMRDLARRTGLLELKIFVLAVSVHRQTGGNMSELLQKLGTVIRERYRIRGAISALTAEGQMQAIILLGLPPLLMAVMFAINRPYMQILFQHPSLLAATAASMTVGGLWMRKIINFDF